MHYSMDPFLFLIQGNIVEHAKCQRRRREEEEKIEYKALSHVPASAGFDSILVR